MTKTYSTYEAKAKFSEILRRVRAGERIVIAYRGEEVAEIRPIEATPETFAQRLARLEKQGVIAPARRPVGLLKPLAKRPGALTRFLESRD